MIDCLIFFLQIGMIHKSLALKHVNLGLLRVCVITQLTVNTISVA